MMYAGADWQVWTRTPVDIDFETSTPHSVKKLLVRSAGAWLKAHVVYMQLSQTTMCDSRIWLLAIFMINAQKKLILPLQYCSCCCEGDQKHTDAWLEAHSLILAKTIHTQPHAVVAFSSRRRAEIS